MKTVLTLIALALVNSATVAADDAAVEQQETAVATPEQIDQWIVELGDARFATRRQATEQLVEAGAPVIEPVVEAALSGTAEVAVRCVQILRRLHDSDDAATSEAAQAGLKSLAESENALVNERALAALNETQLQPVPPGPAGAIQIQVQGGVIAAGNLTVRTTVNNGQRTVNVNDNGKEIEIRDQDGKDIEVTVTETVNGQEETSEYSAEDLDDLKQNHPEIAELYEKYTRQNAIQFQVFAAQMQQVPNLPRRAIPVPFGPNQPAQEDQNQQTAEEIASAIERLESVSAALQQLKDSEDADKDALEELVQELNSILEELAATQDHLDD